MSWNGGRRLQTEYVFGTEETSGMARSGGCFRLDSGSCEFPGGSFSSLDKCHHFDESQILITTILLNK